MDSYTKGFITAALAITLVGPLTTPLVDALVFNKKDLRVPINEGLCETYIAAANDIHPDFKRNDIEGTLTVTNAEGETLCTIQHDKRQAAPAVS